MSSDVDCVNPLLFLNSQHSGYIASSLKCYHFRTCEGGKPPLQSPFSESRKAHNVTVVAPKKEIEKYAPIKVSENNRLDIFGKVLGKSDASAITGHCR